MVSFGGFNLWAVYCPCQREEGPRSPSAANTKSTRKKGERICQK